MPREPETMHRCSSSARSAYEQLWLAGSTVYGRLHTFFRAVDIAVSPLSSANDCLTPRLLNLTEERIVCELNRMKRDPKSPDSKHSRARPAMTAQKGHRRFGHCVGCGVNGICHYPVVKETIASASATDDVVGSWKGIHAPPGVIACPVQGS
ncbi:hypothetical protein AnigIFM63326_000436 [Aspergillus niger]|nr:hypothetical protein AnigIFM63326_000436 [Aspergillus niger]